ncbi:MAG TPA: T9SS C-terminal target domain-containing protein, partial [Ignavibacteria bacterium]|nr:T9SS C-terminal target domain-containing protein [Ignavibacteria bacterium]
MREKILSTVFLLFLFVVQTFAQSVVLSGNITSDKTLTSDKTYLLSGFVRVKSGATLTIQPGTTIYG